MLLRHQQRCVIVRAPFWNGLKLLKARAELLLPLRLAASLPPVEVQLTSRLTVSTTAHSDRLSVIKSDSSTTPRGVARLMSLAVAMEHLRWRCVSWMVNRLVVLMQRSAHRPLCWGPLV